jgi:RNA polymerase sigma-70 factor (ECF subfamily)
MRSNGARTRTPSDAELVARIAAGEERALGRLYDAYGAVAYSLACAMTGDRTTAEEVVVDAFADVVREARAFDASRPTVAAWLASLVRRRALAHRRAGGPAPGAGSERGAQRDEECAEGRAGRGTATAQHELGGRRAAARSALAALAEEERRVLELACFGGRATGEIAVVLGVPEERVRRLLRSALAGVRATLPSRAETFMDRVGTPV